MFLLIWVNVTLFFENWYESTDALNMSNVLYGASPQLCEVVAYSGLEMVRLRSVSFKHFFIDFYCFYLEYIISKDFYCSIRFGYDESLPFPKWLRNYAVGVETQWGNDV